MKRLEWITAIILSGAIAFLLLLRMQHAGALWRDECASVQLATLPSLSDVWHNFQRESFPLVFDLKIRAYAALFGTSDHAFRVFGFLVGLTLLAVFWVNARLLDNGPPLVALTLLGLNTTFLVWGTGIRGYGIGSLLILLAFGLVARFLVKPARLTFVGALLACLASVQYLLYDSVLVLVILGAGFVVCWLRGNRRQGFALLGIGIVSAISVLPYLGPFRHESQSTVVFQGPVGFGWFAEQLALSLGSPVGLMVAIWVALLVAVLAGGAIRLNVKEKSAPEWDHLFFSLAVAVVGFVSYMAFLRLVSYRTREWYYLALLAILAGAVDLIASYLARVRWVRITRLGLVVVMAVAFTWSAWPKVHERQTNMNLVGDTLALVALPDDLIVVNPWFLGISFSRYYHGSAPWVTCPMMDDHRFHRFDLLKEKLAAPHPIDDLLQRIASTLQSGHRVWFVGDVKILPPEARAIVLPPAPSSEFGWSGDAYSETWSQQLGDLVRGHVQDWERLPEIKFVDLVPIEGPVSELENVPIATAHGWRD